MKNNKPNFITYKQQKTQEKEKNIKRQNTAPLICSSSSTIPYVDIFHQPHPAQQSSICLGLSHTTELADTGPGHSPL
jgi:hypothetical protein